MPNARPWQQLRLLLLVPGSAVLLYTGCRGDDSTFLPVPVTVSLENNENTLQGAPVHLFKGAETFPCCSVAPGLNRSVQDNVKYNDYIHFKAGRNGKIIGEVNCTCRNNCPSSRTTAGPSAQGFSARVKWDGTALVCEGPGGASSW